ncbi:hypothetical protein P0R31_39555 [Bradyrhizobium yuanmingense]|uniref:hypothetical protein n=1 Tax=Bradyrhizobium yuanmingense TaxID=108015 RepID=UPI0023B90184|nr:hypothetical protein [Bradyrhizobium yuanmingense]MDF0523291.1 hypothetical protein [Bradyrhizobium yuanmingense]
MTELDSTKRSQIAQRLKERASWPACHKTTSRRCSHCIAHPSARWNPAIAAYRLRTAAIADKCDAHHEAQLQAPRCDPDHAGHRGHARQAKLGQAGPISICRLCETLSVALRFSNINMEGMYQRRPSAHSSLCATGAAAARLQLRA